MRLAGWDGKSHRHAAAHLFRLANELPRPWSVAELRLDDADYQRLLAWARREDGKEILRRLRSTNVEALPEPSAERSCHVASMAALVLLALFAECVGRTGDLLRAPWAAVHDALNACSLRDELFGAGKSPRSAVRDALLDAAAELEMRRPDASQDEQHRWYRLLLLQAGLPSSDLPFLPHRLAEPASTFLVGGLQETSPTFRDAWQALVALQRNDTTLDRARRAVAACPFFRAPADDVVSTVRRGRSVSAPGCDYEPSASLEVDLRLEWPTGTSPLAILTPQFDDDPEQARVVLYVDGVPRLSYRRVGGVLRGRGEASYRAELGREWTLLSSDGTLSAIVSLIPSGADVACFDAKGRETPVSSPAVRYVVAHRPLCAPDGVRVLWLEAAGLGVAEVDAGVSLAFSDGEVVWPPGEAVYKEAGDAVEIQVEGLEPHSSRGGLRVRLGHAPSTRVVSAFVGSSALAVTRSTTATTIVEGTLLPRELQPECALRLRLETPGQRVQRTLRLRVRTEAALDDAWLEPGAIVEASRLEAGALRLSLGPELRGFDATVLAGSQETRVDPSAPRAGAPKVLGFGESLSLVGGRVWEDGPRHELATRVEDHGVVVAHEVQDGRLVLRTRGPLELDDEHWMAVWPRRGPPKAAKIEPSDGSTTSLRSEPDGDASCDVRAVALCFRDAVLGASWADDWSEELPADLDPGVLVCLVRTLHLPVLAEPHLSRVQSALEADDTSQSRARRTAATLFALVKSPALDLGSRRLGPRVDRTSLWRHVARALALKLRLGREAEVTGLRDLLYGEIELTHPRPETRPPVQGDVLAAFREWNRQHGDVEQHALLAAGVPQPLDAVDVLARGSAGAARRLVDAACGLTYHQIEGLDRRQRAAVRNKALEAARHRLRGPVPLDDLLSEARSWAACRPAQPPSRVLRALLHESAHRLLQLELLSDRLPKTP